MNEQEALARMVAPGQYRPYVASKRGGILQIQITRACDKACFNCTQASNLGGKPVLMAVDEFERACQSLEGYFGVVGVFGGNPALHPQFAEICEVFRRYFPIEQRGLWCNHPRGKGLVMRETFNPAVSNLNVHGDGDAWNEFEKDWPESQPFGLTQESRHSPMFTAMTDLGVPVEERWRLISQCDINQHWSALVGVVPGRGLRAFFCEIAYTQCILHADEPDYPDTGIVPFPGWWRLPMRAFVEQVRKQCHECGAPLRGYGELANAADGREQVTATHAASYKPKVKGRRVELVLAREQLGRPLADSTAYIMNAGA